MEAGQYAVSAACGDGKFRYSYHMIKETGEFVVDLTTESLAYATDWCGVRSGKDVDKWTKMRLTKGAAEKLCYAPIIQESPVNIECKVSLFPWRIPKSREDSWKIRMEREKEKITKRICPAHEWQDLSFLALSVFQWLYFQPVDAPL